MQTLAFSTNAFKAHTLDEALVWIAQAGYGAVELMADVPHAFPPSLDSAARKRLGQRVADLGMRVSNINAFTHFADGDTYHPTWIEHDHTRRMVRVDHTRACLELASDMNCRTVSLQPGGPLIGTGLTRSVAGRRFADGIERLIPVAARLGVILAIEPEPGLLIQSAEEFNGFVDTFFPGENSVAMNCDIGHLFCVGDDPAAVIASLPRRISHVHLEDIGENRVHQHLCPGRGVIDFASVFDALTRIGYDGFVTVELYPYQATAAAVAQAAIDHLTKIRSRPRI
jgi:sugar phosphate isomerase/epimerase